jgi:hypothetical protein
MDIRRINSLFTRRMRSFAYGKRGRDIRDDGIQPKQPAGPPMTALSGSALLRVLSQTTGNLRVNRLYNREIMLRSTA